jgi:ABC-type multidrug transport system permease subunit
MNDPGPIFETRAARERSFLEALTGSPLWQLTLVRFREFVREPEALFWAFLFPTVLAVLLGVAFRNRPAESLPVASVTPELTRALRRDKTLDARQMPPGAAEGALRSGQVALMAAPGPAGSVIYRYDDTNPEGRTARMRADEAVQRAAGRADPVSSTDLLMREPGSRYIDFLIPGLLGLNLMGNSVWGVTFAIVDARRKRLLKRLIAAPMPRRDYLLSFVLSRLGLLVAEAVLLLGFGYFVFGVPLRGSWVSLGLLCVLGSLSFCALGLLIASRLRTIEGASGMTNAAMVPMWICSGVFFSAQRFPDFLQPAIKALPLTALIDALRANMLQGAGLAQAGPQIGVLAAWLVVCFALALKLFRWK